MRDVTLRNITIKEADRTFVLVNVEGLKLENVVIGGQQVGGQLDWREAGRLNELMQLARGFPGPAGRSRTCKVPLPQAIDFQLFRIRALGNPRTLGFK